jgi:branched-chain amino acid transport system permease protein
MNQFLIALIAGVGTGSLYAMLGTGLVVAFRGSGVINLGHGAVAGYSAYAFNELRTSGDLYLPWFDIIPEWGFLKTLHINNIPTRIHVFDFEMYIGKPPLLPSVLIALGVSILVGLMMHLLVFRPLRNAPILGKVIGSVGVLLYLDSVIAVNFGGQNRSSSGFWIFKPDMPPVRNFLGLGGTIPRANFYLLLTALLMGASVYLLYRYTRFGVATRAADENEKGASLLGYSPQLIAGINWVFSSVLAGIAGIVFLHKTQPSLYATFVVGALGAALFGKLTSIPMTVLGGLIIGAMSSGGVSLAGEDWWPGWLESEGVRTFMPLLVIILVLYFQGDKLPIRGTLSAGKQPSAPASRNVTVGVIAAMGFALILSNVFVSKWEAVLTTSILATLFMFSLIVIVGYLGQISLAQYSIAGFAAFMMIRFIGDGTLQRPDDYYIIHGLGMPTILSFVCAVIAGTLLGLLMGLPALRIRGVQLAVVTISSVLAIEELLTKSQSLMGSGAASIQPTPSTPTWFGQYIGGFNKETYRTDYWKYSLFLIIITALVGAAVVNLRRGNTGRRFLAIRANERAASAAGINVKNAKMLGFGISSAIASIAGVMLAYKIPAVQAENFAIFSGLGLLAFVYLGGITTGYGAVVGGMLVAGGMMPEFLGLHFGDVERGMINAVGAVGLIVNAIVTGGEGVALLQSNGLGKIPLGLLRRNPDEDEDSEANEEETATEGASI